MKTITFKKTRSAYNTTQITELIQYLTSGKEVSITMGFVYDRFTDGLRIPCSNIRYTDGIWEWGDDLIYYLQNYPLELPEAFIKHGNFKSF
jgi:hypothetical protein